MRTTLSYTFLVSTIICGVFSQYPGPWGSHSGGHRPIHYGKPSSGGRPSIHSSNPFGSRPSLSYGKYPSHGTLDDDPIPAHPSNGDTPFETHQLPNKLPLQAPNGVVEIYNRVVDDLIRKLEIVYRKREIDPMNVVIRPTPSSPVRVPGHLQKRPFRRPGAPLYRSSLPLSPIRTKKGRDLIVIAPQAEENIHTIDKDADVQNKPSFRGSGKISKEPLQGPDSIVEGVTEPITEGNVSESTTVSSTSNVPEAPLVIGGTSFELPDGSSEEPTLFRARSDEYFDEDDEEFGIEIHGIESEIDEKSRTRLHNKKSKKEKRKKYEESEEDDDEVFPISKERKKDIESLVQKYHKKQGSDSSKSKYTTGHSKNKNKDGEGKKKHSEEISSEASNQEIEQDDEEDDEDGTSDDDYEPQSGINPYYPHLGMGPVKPNAQLTGLSKMKRASDVSVTVDARSAVITARLLVGPLNVNINESIEPLERNVRATIPELEAELILMERHGVVFLQRLTLDRAYGQDVEISIPKSKLAQIKKKKISGIGGVPQGPPSGSQGGPLDPTMAAQRFQTKMAAHISMEVVKLLRSGNLRANMMRAAQSSMNKLRLPITNPKKNKSKAKTSSKQQKGKKNRN